MPENKALDIIKKAILLEYRGKALYQSVNPESGNASVKELFNMLAEEEENHITVLNRQYRLISRGEKFDAHGIEGFSITGDSVAANVLKMRLYAGDDIGYFDENEMYIRNQPGTISAWSGCQAGLKVVGIDSVGNVKGCESLYSDYFIEGNLKEEPLQVIWNKKGNFSYNREFDISQLTGHCAQCDKANICRGGCRGSCYFSSDMLYENPYCSYLLKNEQDGKDNLPACHGFNYLTDQRAAGK